MTAYRDSASAFQPSMLLELIDYVELREILKELKLTHAQAAKLMGVHIQTIQKWLATPAKSHHREMPPTACYYLRLVHAGYRPPNWRDITGEPVETHWLIDSGLKKSWTRTLQAQPINCRHVRAVAAKAAINPAFKIRVLRLLRGELDAVNRARLDRLLKERPK